MQFRNDTNKEYSLYHDTLYFLELEPDSYPMDVYTRNANFAQDKALIRIMSADRRWQFDPRTFNTVPIAKHDLQAGISRYTLSDEHLKINRVRAFYNGSWHTLNPVDRRDLNDFELDKSRTGMPVGYDKLGRVIDLYPVPDAGATRGLEIEYQRGSNYFSVTDETKEPGFDPQFHRLVSLYAALDYAGAKGKNDRIPLIMTKIGEMERDIEHYYRDRDVDDRPKMTLAGTDEYVDNLY